MHATTTPPSPALVSRELIGSRPRNLWRYRELLPIAGEPTHRPPLRFHSARPSGAPRRTGFGVRELYVKDDSVNHPTCSYKDRVVSVAATRAGRARVHDIRVRLDGQSRRQRRVARAHASACRAPCSSRTTSEPAKVTRRERLPPADHRGSRQLRRREPAVHAGGRPTTAGDSRTSTCARYAEGAKTYGFEIAEQLGWRFPRTRGVAGGRRHCCCRGILEGLRGAADGRPRLGRAAVDLRGAGGGLRAGHAGARRGAGVPGSGQAADDRQV